MRWIASLLIGIITGISTMLMAFFAADRAVVWYEVSSFEGESGYFIIALALLGLVGGFVIGVVVSRIVARRSKPGFLKALGLSLATSGSIVVIAGTVARFQADIPPRLDGEKLLLAAEIRWPEGKEPPAMESLNEWSLRLGSSTNRTVRASVTGPLWRQDARLEDGRWVVPGAVEVFTSRGERILDVLPDGTIDKGFIVPLPAYPRAEDREWSAWLPHARDGEPQLPDGVRYRFRVVPRSQPIRTETLGPFEVATIADGFRNTSSGATTATWAAQGSFQIRHRGQPVLVEGIERVSAAAAVGGPVPALLVQADSSEIVYTCFLLSVRDAQLRTDRVSECPGGLHPAPLTSDSAVFALARDTDTPPGRFDRSSFATAGRYLFPGAVLDTATLTIHPFPADGQPNLIDQVPPLGVSPDGESFVRLEMDDVNRENQMLAVTVPGTGERYRLPLDKARMRYATFDQIDPAWVLHHFAWERPDRGAYRLVERKSDRQIRPLFGW